MKHPTKMPVEPEAEPGAPPPVAPVEKPTPAAINAEFDAKVAEARREHAETIATIEAERAAKLGAI